MKKQGRDIILTKKMRGLQNDLLSEKLLLEKTRAEESEELKKLGAIENERDDLQKVGRVNLVRCVTRESLLTAFIVGRESNWAARYHDQVWASGAEEGSPRSDGFLG